MDIKSKQNILSLKLLLFLSGFVIYLFVFSILPNNSFWICDNGNRFIILKQYLVEQNNPLELIYKGKEVDPEQKYFPIPYPFAVKKNDKFISQYHLLFPKISSFFYKHAGFKGILILPLLGGLLTSFLFFYYDKSISLKYLIIKWLILFFGTPIFFYSFLFWEHTLAIFFFSLSLIILRLKRKTNYQIIILFIISIILREESFLAIIAIIYALSTTKMIAIKPSSKDCWLSLFFLSGIAYLNKDIFSITHYFNNINFGHTFKEALYSKIIVINNLLFANNPDTRLSILVTCVLIILIIFSYMRKKNIAIYLLIYNLLILFYLINLITTNQIDLYLLKGSGLFFSWPLFFISFLILLIYPKPETKWIAKYYFSYLLITIIFCPLFSSYGFHFSARIMLFIIPVTLIHLIQCFVKNINHQISYWIKTMIVFTIVLNISIQLTSIYFIYLRKTDNENFVSKIKTLPTYPIIVNSSLLSMDLSLIFDSRQIFLIKNYPTLTDLKTMLLRSGYDKVILILKHNTSKSRFLFSQNKLVLLDTAI